MNRPTLWLTGRYFEIKFDPEAEVRRSAGLRVGEPKAAEGKDLRVEVTCEQKAETVVSRVGRLPRITIDLTFTCV